MRNTYKRKAWLLDDRVLLTGYTAKRKFIPNNIFCGFSHQEIHKRDIGRILFYDEAEAMKTSSIICD
jgi:hypothetical protein